MFKKFNIVLFVIFIFSCSYSQDRTENYDNLKDSILKTREFFYAKYNSADSINKKMVIDSAQQYLLTIITQNIFSYWYGTPWEFYGHSRLPNEGSIACGYFVTAVLSDAGFEIPRVKWAQQASELYIRRLSREIKKFSNRPIYEVIEYVEKQDNGLYIVGLDCHVGFIYKENKFIKFVHSNYYQPTKGVMSEDLDSWNPLRDSKYRVLGRILDDNMAVSWINKRKIE